MISDDDSPPKVIKDVEPSLPEMYQCKLCKCKRYETNHREGTIVCSTCGCCEPWMNPDNCRYFSENHHIFSGDDDSCEIRKEIEHWASIPGLNVACGVDDLECALLRALKPPRASVSDRAVASLLLPAISAQIDVSDIARRIENQQPLPNICVHQPKPTSGPFSCSRCGVMVSTQREARHHGCNKRTRFNAVSEGTPVPLTRL